MSRLFGTDGVRGIANTELTAELAYNLGRAGAYVLTEGTHKPKILVAKDTRISGDMLEAALVAGILSVGAEAVCLGVVPTPAVAHLTRVYGADAGVMISASHNPVEYNGIKFFDDKGYKLSDDLEDEIQRVIESGFENVPSPTGANLGREIIEKAALEEKIRTEITKLSQDQLLKIQKDLVAANEKTEKLAKKEKQLSDKLSKKDLEIEKYKKKLEEEKALQANAETATPSNEQFKKAIAKSKIDELKVKVIYELDELTSLAKENQLLDETEDLIADLEKALSSIKSLIK